MPEIVCQNLKPVIGDFGVGGIEIHDIDVARHQPAVAEVVVKPANVRLGQAIAPFEGGPAVAPVHEFIAETEAQAGMVEEV